LKRQRQAYLLSSPLPLSPGSGLSLITFRPLFSRARFTANSGPNVGSAAQGRKKILIVDDERDITLMFRSGLERNGFDVEVINDPLEALSRFRPNNYDLLLVDVRMPGMSGFELWGKIREQDKKVKVCFISAFEIHQEEMKKYLPEEDEKCIVKKPVSMKELIKIITEELAEKH
jgi:CheY-like chemotaxis protein